MTRKKFIGLTSLTTLALGMGSVSWLQRGRVRIAPVTGKKYSPSFLAFCERARFHSVKEAVKSVRDQTSEFQVVVES